jgi:membrane protein DedA with SNARE-associated domain
MLHTLVEQLAQAAVSLIETLGYWGILIGMTIESACIPLPSEVIMLFGGFLAAAGTFNFWFVAAAGVLGNVAGSVLTYWIGANGGRSLLQKYGKYLLINPGHLDKADRWFSRYGEWTVFFARNLPVIRTFISLPAGLARMNFAKFFVYTFAGKSRCTCRPGCSFLQSPGRASGSGTRIE